MPSLVLRTAKHFSTGLAICALGLLSTARPVRTEVAVTADVDLVREAPRGKPLDKANVVVWLTPLAEASSSAARGPSDQRLQLLQKNKSFDPHVLVVRVGSVVEFPNRDPFFHNVFSRFEGKRFDLGLYEAGSTRAVHFDRPGICYIFCNIHPQMSAVVIVLKTPYYGVSDRGGRLSITGVPSGNYRLEVWDEGTLPEALKSLSREVTLTERTRSLGTLRLTRSHDLPVAHKNKYGRDYENPMPPNPVYTQP